MQGLLALVGLRSSIGEAMRPAWMVHQVLPVVSAQLPAHHLGEQAVDVAVLGALSGR
jgi:hypothetical protein